MCAKRGKKLQLERNGQHVILLQFFWLKLFCKRSIPAIIQCACDCVCVSWKIIKLFETIREMCQSSRITSKIGFSMLNLLFSRSLPLCAVAVLLNCKAMTFNFVWIVLLMPQDIRCDFPWPESRAVNQCKQKTCEQLYEKVIWSFNNVTWFVGIYGVWQSLGKKTENRVLNSNFESINRTIIMYKYDKRQFTNFQHINTFSKRKLNHQPSVNFLTFGVIRSRFLANIYINFPEMAQNFMSSWCRYFDLFAEIKSFIIIMVTLPFL